MSIKTVCTVVLVHAFEQRFEQDAFRRVRDVFHSGHNFYAVVLQALSVYRHFILIA